MAEIANDQQLPGVATTPSSHTAEGLSLLRLLKVLRKRIITVIVSFVVTLTIICVWTALSPLKYTTSTQLFATYNSSTNGANVVEQNTGNSYIMSQIKSYPTLTTTEAVLQPVIDDLRLDKTAAQLADEISVVNPTNTAFINISVTDTDAKLATQIANSVAVSLSKVVEKSLYSTNADSPVKLSIVQPAQQPTAPSSPKWTMNILVGILAGLIIGIVAALIKDLLSKKIQDDDEIGEYINAPIIGRIAESDMLNATSPVIVNEPGSPIAEDFRRVRTNLSFLVPMGDTNCRLIAISSTGAGEGKTTTSVNIAAALAENGARVLLIDADLRHPSVAHKIDLDGSAGLTHVLAGQASVKDVIQRYWKPNLHIMPAGPKPPNASALLNSPTMTELLNNAVRQYDYVLIDTAPMIVANDAAIFLRHGGSLVMVCRRDQTTKHDLQEISEELTTLDLTVSGVVFNCARENKKAIENSNYYYYSNQNASGKGRKKR